ncbi:MAG: glycosyltransferase [Nitrospirae bacterium]|nr:glycosyltransferase [Nitrospirota bacterium]
MKQMPLFSVIIPTFNRADLLRRAVDSVLAQTFGNFEVIVIDNHSSDHTAEILASYKDDRVSWHAIRNNGIIAASRNLGIRKAAGEWISFLDSDDWWHPAKLETVCNYLEQADVVYHGLNIHTPKGKSFLRSLNGRQVKSPVFVDLMIRGNALSTSSVTVRKDIAEKIGCFSEEKSLIAVEDFDLWLRISRITERFIFIPKKLGGYWLADGNATAATEKHAMRLKAVYDRHIAYLNNKKDCVQAEAVVSYGIGRIQQKLDNREAALAQFKKAVRSSVPEIRCKALFCITQLVFSMIGKQTQ